MAHHHPIFYDICTTTKIKSLFVRSQPKYPQGLVYNKHLIQRLYDTNKYDIAEFAAYGLIGDKENLKFLGNTILMLFNQMTKE